MWKTLNEFLVWGEHITKIFWEDVIYWLENHKLLNYAIRRGGRYYGYRTRFKVNE